MRVAEIVGKIKAGGVESVVFEYLRRIDLTDLEIDVLYDDDSDYAPPGDIAARGIGIIKIPAYQKLPKYMSTVKKICRERRYDIVHSHINALSCFPLRAAKRAGVACRIAHDHTTSSKSDGWRDVVKRAARGASARAATDYAACSEAAARWMFGDRTVDAGEVRIIPNVTDPARFAYSEISRDALRRELGLGDSFVLLHIGRFVKTKNHQFTLDAFDALTKRRPGSKLILVGDGELSDDIKRRAAGMSCRDDIIFTGVVADPERYYSAADALILPSFYEGLPVVVIEAQSSGLPCFVSDRVTKECDVSGAVRYLSISSPPDEWAKAVSVVAPQERVSAHEAIEGTGFDIGVSAKLLRDYYFEVAHGRRKR
ncbi:MAG: glycosyltransferase [Clostridia bacterium]|nr:glycosyltransferase [Clostridia bacterium]